MASIDDDGLIKNLDRRAERFEVLSRELELEYIVRCKNGDSQAWQSIYDHNIRLLKKISRRYLNRGLDMEDLVQEAALGLLHAVKLFDTSKGFKLSTYATWWIKQYVQRAVSNKSRTIRIPIHKQNEIVLVQKTFHQFIEDHGRHPDSAELAKETGLDQKTVEKLRHYMQDLASLNESVSEDEDGLTRIDLEIASSGCQPEEIIEDSSDRTKVREWMSQLEQSDRNIAMYYFGFMDQGDKSESDVARFFQMPLSMAKRRLKEIKTKLRSIADHTEINSDFIAHVVLMDLGPIEARERLIFFLKKELGMSLKDVLAVISAETPIDLPKTMKARYPERFRKKVDGRYPSPPGAIKLSEGKALQSELEQHGIKIVLNKS